MATQKSIFLWIFLGILSIVTWFFGFVVLVASSQYFFAIRTILD